MENFTVSTFSPYIGQKFRIDVGAEQPIELTLIEATEMGERYYRKKGARAPFHIVFRGPPGAHLPQRIYPVEHETLGSLPLFLVPIQPDDEGPLFQAVFN